jgi:hypothetical protein
LAGVLLDHLQQGFGGRVEVGRSPIAGEGRVEWRPEPVEDHGLADLGQQPSVDREVVVGAAGDADQRPAGHDHDPRPGVLDDGCLVLIGVQHVFNRHRAPAR